MKISQENKDSEVKSATQEHKLKLYANRCNYSCASSTLNGMYI